MHPLAATSRSRNVLELDTHPLTATSRSRNVLELDTHPLAATSRSRLLEMFYYAFCGRYCF